MRTAWERRHRRMIVKGRGRCIGSGRCGKRMRNLVHQRPVSIEWLQRCQGRIRQAAIFEKPAVAHRRQRHLTANVVRSHGLRLDARNRTRAFQRVSATRWVARKRGVAANKAMRHRFSFDMHVVVQREVRGWSKGSVVRQFRFSLRGGRRSEIRHCRDVVRLFEHRSVRRFTHERFVCAQECSRSEQAVLLITTPQRSRYFKATQHRNKLSANIRSRDVCDSRLVFLSGRACLF